MTALTAQPRECSVARTLEVVEPTVTQEHLAQGKEGPLLSDDLQGSRHGALARLGC